MVGKAKTTSRKGKRQYREISDKIGGQGEKGKLNKSHDKLQKGPLCSTNLSRSFCTANLDWSAKQPWQTAKPTSYDLIFLNIPM